MAGFFNSSDNKATKKVLSPKRRRQRLGGVLIIGWAIYSLIAGFSTVIEDIENSWISIVATVVFCLAGAYFIYLSFKPDLSWEETQKSEEVSTEEEEEEEEDNFIPLSFDDDEIDNQKRKYLE